MSKRGRGKDLHGSTIRRSEYDDGILRHNMRSDLRHKNEMVFQDRAQKVIMKELGKESMILQTKLENDRKTIALGLFGSKMGLNSYNTPRKNTTNGPITASVTNSYTPTLRTQSSRTDVAPVQKFPWDVDVSSKDSDVGKERTNISGTSSPVRSKFRTNASSYPSARAQSDDFLTSILNEAMNAELMYSQSQELKQESLPETTTKTPRSAKRKMKTPRNSALTARSEQRGSALGIVQEKGYG